MAQLSDTALLKKDILTCLGIWLTLELICFGVLPLLNVIEPQGDFQTWLVISLPMGVGGSLLAGTSPHLKDRIGDRPHKAVKPILKGLTAILSWVGLFGMAFPLLAASIEIFVGFLVGNV